MLQMDLPHINVLTKIDKVAGYDPLPFDLDFYTDVLYSPPEAWHTGTNEACQTDDHFTAEVNASATINFVGECPSRRVLSKIFMHSHRQPYLGRGHAQQRERRALRAG